MRTKLSFLALLPILITACGPTRIVTVSSNAGPVAAYSTTVTIPRTHTQTTTARVVAASEDISLFLDLQAVGAAFAQSSTVEQFEDLLNDASYMLNNLDLNNDGYVDYLRVLETVEGHNHLFLVQAVLAKDVYQDVCTLVAEMATSQVYVQVIGAPYIYGPNFIVEPVFYSTPLIYAHLRIAHYNPWRSPWHWDHFPPHYRHPAPVYLTHYQAYVATYMRNHRYCHEFRYAEKYHYVDYDRVTRAMQRNDYGRQHPERSFTTRTANPANNTRMTNARDIYERQAASTVTSTSEPATRNSRTATTISNSRNASAVNANSRSASTATAASNSRSSSASTTSTSRSASTATSTSRSTSGTTATRSSQTSGTSTSRSAATTTSPSRSASTATSTSRSTSGTTATRSANTTSSSTARSASSSSSRTTVSSRVQNSGSAETRTTTVSPSGSTSTTVRASGSTSNSRSAGSSSSTTATRSSSSGSSNSRSASTSSSSRSASSSSSSRSSGNSSPARR